MEFREERGIGYCGLACVLCSYGDCPGCAAKIAEGGDCSPGSCAAGKGLDGCHACPGYPCEEKMPQGKRNRAFNRYAGEFGKQALIGRLRVNYENGVAYHKPDKSPGDYDVLETEDEIYGLLRFGTGDPYQKCPTFDTGHFHLRQVREEDAEDLLACYADLTTWVFYNTEMSKKIFSSPSPTLEEMKACIRFWLDEYNAKKYIRFSITDRAAGKAIGTIELFVKVGMDKNQTLEPVLNGAVLHIDLAPAFETRETISELLALADGQFYALSGAKYLLSRAVPDAKERLAALEQAGYVPFEWEAGREHFFYKKMG